MRTIKEIFRSYGVLDEQGRHVNGTDKQTNHNYGDAYEGLFVVEEPYDGPPPQPHIQHVHQYRSTRDKVKLMLEVGVADGSCLLAWREVFPNAGIVGMDIHPAEMVRGREDIEFHLGNQRSHYDCWNAVNGRLFDLIVEDATHNIEDTLLTFFFLWPAVRPGGLYVVEEWPNVGHFWPQIAALSPFVGRVDTDGPFGGVEPLVAFRKPL